ncbi:MAG: hypothetical protein A2Y18_00405 [Clostridiales bacterium GWD2_32_19]|nr:MAG: hypothetical protein A2Y18_00405 [Clostridiales bacterium GWD2_32_19]
MYINAVCGAIIIVSSFIVLQGAIEYSRIINEFKVFEFSGKKFLKFAPGIILLILWLFFITYISIGVTVGLRPMFNTQILTSYILLLGSIFSYLVIRIQKEMLYYVENSNIESISALVSAIEARDEYTKGHSQHVSNLVEAYYNELSEKEKVKLNIRKLKIAGLLHDIGKIGIKEVILNKVGKLDDDEYAEISKHPQIGNVILGSVSNLTDIASWIYYHHERVDGTGYYNKAYDEIPVESRILSVADTYSALVTDRVYRKGMSHEKALEIMQMVRETQLDGEIVDKFIKIPEEKLDKCKVCINFVQ